MRLTETNLLRCIAEIREVKAGAPDTDGRKESEEIHSIARDYGYVVSGWTREDGRIIQISLRPAEHIHVHFGPRLTTVNTW